MVEAIPCGVYEHYKGNRYLVIGIARHDTTEEPLVIYTRLYTRAGFPLSARPYADFTGCVMDTDGAQIKRFRFIGATEDNPPITEE